MNLHEIDNAVFAVWRRVWNLKWLKPTNQQEEMEKFFADDGYEPRFLYEKLDFDVAELDAQLERYGKELDGKELVAKMLKDKISKLRSWLMMLATRGTEAFTEHAIDYYGKPGAELIKKAEGMIDIDDADDQVRDLTAEEIVPLLQQSAKSLGLKWNVKAKDGLASRADCVIPDRTLYIREDAKFSRKDIKKLAVHELATHARRAINGEGRDFKLFEMGTAEYETTEEGLASFMEGLEGVATKRGMKRKAALVLIVDRSLRQGFREVYGFVRKRFPEESAFRLVVKAKRGLGDTGKPGAFTKDHLYLKGLELVRKERFIDDLFWGRIAVEDLEPLRMEGFIPVVPRTTARSPASGAGPSPRT